jgi:2'-hydroxyisoflavone reductase
MKLLLLGGTGFLGPAIVEAGLANKHELTLFNRGKTHPNLFPNVEKLQGDRDKGDYKSLEGREWDAVIDTSANVPAWVRESTKVLAGKVKQYLFTSTISVYPQNSFQKPGKDETAPVEQWPEGADERKFVPANYGSGKALCEKLINEAFPGHATIVRPGLIVGPGDFSDRFTYWPVRIEKGGEVLAPGDPNSPVQFIDSRDLGNWIVTMVEDGHTGTYNATGPRDRLSMAEMLYGIKAITTSGAQFTWVDEKFLLEQKVGPWMEMPLWVPQDEDSRGFSAISIAKALAVGLTFRPLADTARDALAYSKTLPTTRKLHAGLAPEKEQAVLKAWHEQKGPPASQPS